jgi:hypothetical protein
VIPFACCAALCRFHKNAVALHAIIKNNSWRMKKRWKKGKRKYDNPEMTLLPFNICRN